MWKQSPLSYIQNLMTKKVACKLQYNRFQIWLNLQTHIDISKNKYESLEVSKGKGNTSDISTRPSQEEKKVVDDRWNSQTHETADNAKEWYKI